MKPYEAAAVLANAADILQRGLGRSPDDICTCGCSRGDHIGQGVGCVGTWCWRFDDGCKRFRHDVDGRAGRGQLREPGAHRDRTERAATFWLLSADLGRVMSNEDHAALLKVAAQWERLYGELFVKAQRLTDENVRLRAALEGLLHATFANWAQKERDALRVLGGSNDG